MFSCLCCFLNCWQQPICGKEMYRKRRFWRVVNHQMHRIHGFLEASLVCMSLFSARPSPPLQFSSLIWDFWCVNSNYCWHKIFIVYIINGWSGFEKSSFAATQSPVWYLCLIVTNLLQIFVSCRILFTVTLVWQAVHLGKGKKNFFFPHHPCFSCTFRLCITSLQATLPYFHFLSRPWKRTGRRCEKSQYHSTKAAAQVRRDYYKCSQWHESELRKQKATEFQGIGTFHWNYRE